MLLQFAVTNYLSFRERTVLSALAADHVDHDPKHILTTPNGTKVLRVLALYGANASGKSNLIKAMDFACRFVVEGVLRNATIDVMPFKFMSRPSGKTSDFEFELISDNQHWSYGFSVSYLRVESEWLYLIKEDGNEQLIFQRNASQENIAPLKITFGSALLENEKFIGFAKFAEQVLRFNVLLISEMPKFKEAFSILKWFHELHSFKKTHESKMQLIRRMSSSTGKVKDFLNHLLAKSGTGINRVEFPISLNAKLFRNDEEPAFTVEMLEDHNKISSMSRRDLINALQEAKSINLPVSVDVRLTHQKWDLMLEEESDGTQRLIYLAPTLYSLTQKDNETIVIIDELERSLHPNLTRFILQTVLESEGTGQLIFTTHDTNLLDRTLLPEDSIWFVEKNDEGASSMYSLAEFQPEQLDQLGNSLERGYLQGRFGAIPFLGDPRRLGWISKEQTEKATEDKPAEDKQ